MIRNRCALQRIPPRSWPSEASHTKAAPSRRDATMMTLLPDQSLGFPRYAGGLWGGGTPTPLKREWRCPRASPRRCRPSGRDFSRPPKNHDLDTPSRSTNLAAPQLAPPQSCNHHCCFTVDQRRRPRRPRGGILSLGESGQQPRGRAQPPPPPTSTNRTQLQEYTRPLWPGRARRAREAPMAALQSARRRPNRPQPEQLHRPPGADAPDLARPSPDGARGAQIRASRRHRWPPFRPAAKRPRRRRQTTRSRAACGASASEP
jgi:hypothetical protein